MPLLAGGAAGSCRCCVHALCIVTVVATDGSLKKSGIMGAAMVAKDGHLLSRSVAVNGQPSSIRPKLTGMALTIEDCLGEDNLNIVTDSLSALQRMDSLSALPVRKESRA